MRVLTPIVTRLMLRRLLIPVPCLVCGKPTHQTLGLCWNCFVETYSPEAS